MLALTAALTMHPEFWASLIPSSCFGAQERFEDVCIECRGVIVRLWSTNPAEATAAAALPGFIHHRFVESVDELPAFAAPSCFIRSAQCRSAVIES
jgi:hypothetical protein